MKIKDTIIQDLLKLDGVAAVNLDEPSDGDLKRVCDAYDSVRLENENLRFKIDELQQEIWELKSELWIHR